MIEAEDERKRARARQPAIGRFQPENPAERRRHPDRAIGVRAERQRNQRAADRAAGAARRAAGHPRHIMRIARGSVVDVFAGEVVGVFAHVERADQHGAGGFQPFDQRRIARGGGRSRLIFDPARVGRPCTSNRFFTAKGTPASGPGFFPAAIAASTARALARARSAVTSVKEFRTRIVFGDPRQRGFGDARAPRILPLHGARDFQGSASSAGRRTRYQAVKTLAGSASSGRANSSTIRASLMRHFEIGPHRGLPGFLDRQPQRL